MIFPSAEWVAAWLAVCNEDPDFVAAGEGWDGAAGCGIRADPDRGLHALYLRLDGVNGRWTGHQLGPDPALVADSNFLLSADYDTWRAVICQDLHPIRAMISGRVRVKGQLSYVLRWSRPMVMMTKLAGRLDTDFIEVNQ